MDPRLPGRVCRQAGEVYARGAEHARRPAPGCRADEQQQQGRRRDARHAKHCASAAHLPAHAQQREWQGQ